MSKNGFVIGLMAGFVLYLSASMEAPEARAMAYMAKSPSVQLGTIEFENSGARVAQDDFIRGVLLLHSFEFSDALAAFLEAQALDPDFAMAYWGEAMTFNHPLWAEQDYERGRAALAKYGPDQKSRRARIPTERERMYFDAIEIIYGEGDKYERDRKYRKSMQALYRAWPEDNEAAAFYALSILGSVPARDFRTFMLGASIAEDVIARNPDHPGAAHYLIHSYDDPLHAPLGVRAADRYSKIAPGASHAQHMVSHIYTALGRWQDVITANEAAVRVSQESLERAGAPVARRSKHALQWLQYALYQAGQGEKARSKMQIMVEDWHAVPNNNQLMHYQLMRAEQAVDDLGSTTLPPAIDVDIPSLEARTLGVFASGFAPSGQQTAAETERALSDLRVAIKATRIVSANEGVNQFEGATIEDSHLISTIIADQLEALLAFRNGKHKEAIAVMRRALVAEESRPLEYGPPTIIKPSAELLGEMMLTLERPREATDYFTKSLARHTARTRSLLGLSRAAEAMGDNETASEAWDTIMTNWAGDENELRNSGYPWLAPTQALKN